MNAYNRQWNVLKRLFDLYELCVHCLVHNTRMSFSVKFDRYINDLVENEEKLWIIVAVAQIISCLCEHLYFATCDSCDVTNLT